MSTGAVPGAASRAANPARNPATDAAKNAAKNAATSTANSARSGTAPFTGSSKVPGTGAVLLVDIGNTRLKWAWCEPGADANRDTAAHQEASGVNVFASGATSTPWRHLDAVPHADLGTLAVEWAALRASLCAEAGEARPSIWISNVAGAAVAATVSTLLANAFGADAPLHWVRSTAGFGDLGNGYRDPLQLGVDRWVGAIGAHAHWPHDNLLIVTAGTATTLDIVTVDGGRARFVGGLILPGLDLMRGALACNTAQLPQVGADGAGAVLARGWADNTHDAIAAGCLAAQAGAIERTWRTLAVAGPLRCLLSGGARHVLATAFVAPVAGSAAASTDAPVAGDAMAANAAGKACAAIAFELHDNLVLLGLHVMATRAQESTS